MFPQIINNEKINNNIYILFDLKAKKLYNLTA